MEAKARPLPEKVGREVRRHKPARRLARRILALLPRLVMFLLATGGCLAGAAWLWRQAWHDPRFRLKWETLGMTGALRECPESMPALAALGLRFEGRSLLDPLLVSDMEKAFGGSVWIRKIVRLRRNFPNRMELEFVLRLPEAQVWHDSQYWLVDREAAILPVAGSLTPFPNLPEIVGITADVIRNRPELGQAWRDEGVAGAMGIILAFRGSPLSETLPVEKVLVSAGVFRRGEENREREKRRRFEVMAAGGTVIRWGTYNPGPAGGEPTSAEKLWELQELLRNPAALKPGVSFDVRTRLSGFTLLE